MLKLIARLFEVSEETSIIIGILIAVFFAICSVSLGNSKDN